MVSFVAYRKMSHICLNFLSPFTCICLVTNLCKSNFTFMSSTIEKKLFPHSNPSRSGSEYINENNLIFHRENLIKFLMPKMTPGQVYYMYVWPYRCRKRCIRWLICTLHFNLTASSVNKNGKCCPEVEFLKKVDMCPIYARFMTIFLP